MACWPKVGSHSSERDTGGRQAPPLEGQCAKCNRQFQVDEMQIETNDHSAAFGYYTCENCFDGPYPDLTFKAGNDDIGPVPNILHT